MLKSKSKRLIKELSLRYGIPELEMTYIINSQFDFVKHKIKESSIYDLDSFKTIMLPNFGKFTVKQNLEKAQENTIKKSIKK